MKKILITGGCGYVGTELTKELLKDGYIVIVIDTQWFGNYLKPHKNLKVIKADLREIDKIPINDVDTILHLANIANDPAVEMTPTLSWEVNVLAGQQIIDKAVRNGVKNFIFASSGSVYGLKEEKKVTEDLTLVPISVYNKTKMIAERVFLSYKNDLNVYCIRPATVCGISDRMRFDVSVNMLTLQAVKNKKITVFGGDQVRPNIHIKDLINVYKHFLTSHNISSGCYNAGFENVSILNIAETVKRIIPAEIIITESNDPRSYRQDSTKLINTGFTPKFSIHDAINEIAEGLNSGNVEEKENSYTVKWMRKLNLDKN